MTISLYPFRASLCFLWQFRFSRLRDVDGEWVGVSGRARTVAYSTDEALQLPDSIFGYTDPSWSGRIGWAPANGSFQAFVTALRVLEGQEVTSEWLRGILANDPLAYPKNTAAVEGVALDYRPDWLESVLVEESDRLRSGRGSLLLQTVRNETQFDRVIRSEGEVRFAQPGETGDGSFMIGPGPMGSFFSFTPDHNSIPRGQIGRAHV